MQSKVNAIERIVGTEVGRGIQRLVLHSAGNLLRAARSVARHPAPCVGICTGFYIPQGLAAETDGPVGAALLAAGLAENAVPVHLITDRLCHQAVSAAATAASRKLKDVEIYDPDDKHALARHEFTHMISIERAGPSQSGKVYNMSGMDITETTPDVHKLFASGRWTKIAVGDGGNEVGMGSLPRHLVREDIKHGETIACVTPSDHLVVAGVSNWGAWGLLAALMILRPDWNLRLFLNPERAKQVLLRCLQEGRAIDGVTLKAEATVDGLDWDVHESILNQILDACDQDVEG